MSAPAGHIELERTVESIIIGHRHRAELGDIDALAASIERDGLLQPPTITPDGVLVCGARRLAAIKRLGWRRVSVWVRSGISDQLGLLLAERDDNLLHKPLTPIEAAALYREIKGLMAEDAARRKALTQFQDGHKPGSHGPADSAAPASSLQLGDARQQAAQMVTGSSSYTRLEQIGFLQRLAADPAVEEALRTLARDGLAQVEAGQAVNPIFQRVRTAQVEADTERDLLLHDLASDALERAHAAKRAKSTKAKNAASPRPRSPAESALPLRYSVRAFVITWGEMESWWSHYDLDELAVELTDGQVDAFFATVDGTVEFTERLREARARMRSGRPLLRAL